VKSGQRYDIFNKAKGKGGGGHGYIEKTEYIGSLILLSTEEETSAALITYAHKIIAPGDVISAPM